jgi:hypothetical protein
MAFEITVAEALALLRVTPAELRFLVARGDLQQFDVRDRKGKVVRRFLHYEEAVELAKRLERPVLEPKRTHQPKWRRPREPSLLSTMQVARSLGTTPTTIHRIVAEGRLPVALEAGKARYFRWEDVAAFMKQLQKDHGIDPGVLVPKDELVGLVNAAMLLRCCPRKIYACIERGDLPVARVTAAGIRFFRRSDVMALPDLPGWNKRRRRKTA